MGRELWRHRAMLWTQVAEMDYRHERVVADAARTRRPAGRQPVGRGLLRGRPLRLARAGGSSGVAYADC